MATGQDRHGDGQLRRPRSRRAALVLSLSILPGLGHWYLGRRNLGALIGTITLLVFLYPLYRFTGTTTAMLEEQMAAGSTEVWATTWDAMQAAWQQEATIIYWGLGLLAACWLGAALDLWRRRN